MKIEIKVPSVGESIVEATISNILKPAKSFVEKDAEIIELETDKVNQVLYAPEKGVISWSVSVNDVVKIGQVIGTIDTEGKGEAASLPPPPPKEKKAKELKPLPLPMKDEGSSRKMAPEFVKELQEAETPPKAPLSKESDVSRKRMSSLRKVIASKLVEVKNTTAMLTTFNEIDMSAVMEIRAKEKDNFMKRYDVKLGFMSFFVKASVAALKAYPQVNSFIEGDEIVTFNTYDIGVAVGTDKGLFVPVIKGCDALSYGGVEKSIQDFALKAKSGKIGIEDLKGGSFTITNGGTYGSLLSTPILNPPQSAILGMHAITKRAVVVKDEIVIRPMMFVALSYDHRLIDGKDAVLFLVHLKQNLEDPARLLLDL